MKRPGCQSSYQRVAETEAWVSASSLTVSTWPSTVAVKVAVPAADDHERKQY